MLETLKAQNLPRDAYENRRKQLLNQFSLQRIFRPSSLL